MVDAEVERLRTELNRLRDEVTTLNKVKVVSIKGKTLRKFDGTEGVITFEEWRGEAVTALRKQDLQGEEGVNYLLSHLEGTARDEIRYTVTSERDTPDKVYQILQDAFGVRQTVTQLMDAFFAFRQSEKQSVLEYSHELMRLLGKVQKKSPARIPETDVMLRDQFAEKLRDPYLRRELKKRIRQNTALTFKEIREEAYDWEEDEQTPRKRASVQETEGISGIPEATVEIAKAGTGKGPEREGVNQKILSMMEMQQKTLTQMVEAMSGLSVMQSRGPRQVNESTVNNTDTRRVRRCFRCRSTEHMVRNCPEKKEETSGNRGPGRNQTPATGETSNSPAPLNGSTPQ
jgi:hypothetical protein